MIIATGYEPTFLRMTNPFSQWFMILCNLSMNKMMIFRKLEIGPTSGKWPLILINPNELEKLYFFRKTRKGVHPPASFNNMPVVCSSFQKHLSAYLDKKLKFSNHIKDKNSNANKGIGILRNFYNIPLRNSLIAIYRSFV